MATIDSLLKQLNSLSKDDWAKLFNLIPKIEEADNFGTLTGGNEIFPGTFEMPSWEGTDIIREFVNIVNELKLEIDFDWMAWAEGKTMLDNKNQDFDCLDLLSLCKLLTRIIRAERFNDGYLVDNFENGNILKILKAIKRNRENNQFQVTQTYQRLDYQTNRKSLYGLHMAKSNHTMRSVSSSI